VFGPFEQLLAVLAGHPEQLSDNLQRQLGRHVRQEVAGALGDGLIKDAHGQLTYMRFKDLNRPRRENLG
jgi:hypothetical protein